MDSGNLVPSLKSRSIKGDRRGSPENSIDVNEPVSSLRAKRNLETFEIEYGNESPDFSPHKKPMIACDGNGGSVSAPENFLDKGKEAMPADAGHLFAEPRGGSVPKQLPICSSSGHKETSPNFTSGANEGEERQDPSVAPALSEIPLGREERKDQRQQRQPRRQNDDIEDPVDCPWCERIFISRFALGAHGRFCRVRRQQTATQEEVERPPAAGRNFDLNLLPPEVPALKRSRARKCRR